MVLSLNISEEAEAKLKAKAAAAGLDVETFAVRHLELMVSETRQPISQRDAWESFVTGMTAWTDSHLPAGYAADDSRDASYDDRS